MQPRRITSSDPGYRHGDLSVFPAALDSAATLFEVTNNAETRLKHSLTIGAKYVILEDASLFPNSGLVKIFSQRQPNDFEVIYYGARVGNQLHMLQRGYQNTRHGVWNAGSSVTAPVMAEHHNALKDAIIKIQNKIGTSVNPDPQSISGRLNVLEQRWLAPKGFFKAFPKIGPAPLTVKFKNFSTGYGTKFLWDFGDGTNSTEKDPTHTYLSEGNYTVKLNMVSVTKSAGFAEKSDYIQVSNNQRIPFFYGSPLQGNSITTANETGEDPTNFLLVDQTDGDILERHWFFGDGTDISINDPNIHTVSHYYEKTGEYTPVLIARYKDDQLSRANILENLMVF